MPDSTIPYDNVFNPYWMSGASVFPAEADIDARHPCITYTNACGKRAGIYRPTLGAAIVLHQRLTAAIADARRVP